MQVARRATEHHGEHPQVGAQEVPVGRRKRVADPNAQRPHGMEGHISSQRQLFTYRHKGDHHVWVITRTTSAPLAYSHPQPSFPPLHRA